MLAALAHSPPRHTRGRLGSLGGPRGGGAAAQLGRCGAARGKSGVEAGHRVEAGVTAGERTELWGAAVTCEHTYSNGREETGWPGADVCGIYTRGPGLNTVAVAHERAAAARVGLDWIVARRACRHVPGSLTPRSRNSARGGIVVGWGRLGVSSTWRLRPCREPCALRGARLSPCPSHSLSLLCRPDTVALAWAAERRGSLPGRWVRAVSCGARVSLPSRTPVVSLL